MQSHRSQQAIPAQHHVQQSPQAIQQSEAVQATSQDEVPAMTMIDLFKKVYEQPREVMQQLANQDQFSTQPQQIYNQATNPASQLAKQQDRQAATSSAEAPRIPPQQDIIAQFQAHYARQEQKQKQPNTKAHYA